MWQDRLVYLNLLSFSMVLFSTKTLFLFHASLIGTFLTVLQAEHYRAYTVEMAMFFYREISCHVEFADILELEGFPKEYVATSCIERLFFRLCLLLFLARQKWGKLVLSINLHGLRALLQPPSPGRECLVYCHLLTPKYWRAVWVVLPHPYFTGLHIHI